MQTSDVETVGVGWLFAPIIGTWGLARVSLVITETVLSKKYAVLCFLPVFLFHIGLGLASWMVMAYGASWFRRVFFWVNSSSMLNCKNGWVTLLHNKEKLGDVLKNQRTIILDFTALIAMPLFHTATFLFLFIIFAQS